SLNIVGDTTNVVVRKSSLASVNETNCPGNRIINSCGCIQCESSYTLSLAFPLKQYTTKAD
ncbi:hypothetical protein JVW19_22060, partial [Vibrio cholerae O1]|nr:hypothetical protein [Vibrio cholerae O1]